MVALVPLLSCFGDSLNVLNSLIVLDAFTHQILGNSFFAQDIILRLDNDYCRVIFVDIHVCSCSQTCDIEGNLLFKAYANFGGLY